MKLLVPAFSFVVLIAACVPSLRAQQSPPPTQSNPTGAQSSQPSPEANAKRASATTFQVTGSVHSGKTPLPGVTLTASNTLTGKKYSAATISDGTFTLSGLPRGRYVLRAEFMGFAAQTQEVVLNPENPAGKADLELILASRQPQGNAQAIASALAGRGFQNLAMDSTMQAFSGADTAAATAGQNPTSNDLSSLPMNGAGADVATESVSISGVQGRTQDFGSVSESELQDRIQEFRDRLQAGGGGFEGFGGGGPGFGGGFGGGGGPMVIRMGRGGFNVNQPHGFL